MKHLSLIFILIFILIFTINGLTLFIAKAHASQGSSEFRYLSFAVRDRAPTAQEAKDFAGGKDLGTFLGEWLASPEHRTRVFRYFNDMFGVTKHIFIAQDEFALKKNSQGIYYLSAQGHGNCSLSSGSVLVPANQVWWLDENDAAVRMCTDTQNTFITTGTYNTPSYRDCLETNAANGFFHADCGCGPNQILCWPEELKEDVSNAVRFEFANRAVFVYDKNLNWRQLLGGNQFYGNRLLYHVYMYQSRIVSRPFQQNEPTALDLSRLKSLPLRQSQPEIGFIPFPDSATPLAKGSPATRSGIATSPGFLRQFNNFRSRVRALTEKLLCQDVSPAQNTDGISIFVNNDLSDFDKEHGNKESCSGCHFSMDNLGSTLLGWDQNGNFRYYEDLMQTGHAFGVTGTGPEFLMDGYLDRAPTFKTCMAKKAWEDFSGQSWDALSPERKDALTKDAESGPRALIEAVLRSPEMLCSRSSPSSTCQPLSSSKTLSFQDDIKPIIEAQCAGSGCHSQDSVLGPSYKFIDSEAAFKSINSNRLYDNSMPPQGSGKSLTEEQKNLLLNYLGR